jgi:hypothetical protein
MALRMGQVPAGVIVSDEKTTWNEYLFLGLLTAVFTSGTIVPVLVGGSIIALLLGDGVLLLAGVY